MKYRSYRSSIDFTLVSTLIGFVLFGVLPHASATGTNLDNTVGTAGKVITDRPADVAWYRRKRSEI
jgi:hypothetical protein